MLGEQLLGELRERRRRRLLAGASLRSRPTHPVVLDAEDVQPLERVGLRRQHLVEMHDRRTDGVLEEREEQLVLAVEILVEAAQRLAGALDDLLDREVVAVLHEVECRVEEALDPGLGPCPRRVEDARDGEVAAGRAVGRLLGQQAHLDPRTPFCHMKTGCTRSRERDSIGSTRSG